MGGTAFWDLSPPACSHGQTRSSHPGTGRRCRHPLTDSPSNSQTPASTMYAAQHSNVVSTYQHTACVRNTDTCFNQLCSQDLQMGVCVRTVAVLCAYLWRVCDLAGHDNVVQGPLVRRMLAVHLLLHSCQEALHTAAVTANNKHVTSHSISTRSATCKDEAKWCRGLRCLSKPEH